MREVIQCLIDWLVDEAPSGDRPHFVLRLLAQEFKGLTQLTEDKWRVTASEIVAAAKLSSPPESNIKWINWTKAVMPYWESRENQIIEFARKKGLESYPKPNRISTKGGRGNESVYQFILMPLPEPNIEEQLSQPQSDKLTKQASVQYDIAENGEVKAAWGAKWLFPKGQRRLTIWHIWGILGWLFVIGGGTIVFSYLTWVLLTIAKPVTTRELTLLMTVFIFPYAMWIFVIRPWVRLFDDRIIPAPEILVSVKEKSAQLELYRDGELRLIRLVRYTAPCPVCGATIHLENGEPDYPRRLVGRCMESPREHIFSFDRVTRNGTVLRSPY